MPLNRLVEIQHRGVTRDSFGGEIEKWDKLAIVWAERLSVKPSERFIKTAARTVNTSQATFRILARAGVNEQMRLIDDSEITWDIIGIIKNDWKYLTLQVGHLP